MAAIAIKSLSFSRGESRSAFVLNALIEADRVMLLSGNPEPIAVPTDSGRPHEIHRCPSCKVAVWSVYGGISKLRFVRVGTLDGSADAGRPYLCSLQTPLGHLAGRCLFLRGLL
jgi:hypothetical protein